MPTALITTTINVPDLLTIYARDGVAHGHDLKFYVAGDKKTPLEVADLCAKIERDTGITCEYLGVAEQTALMRGWPTLDECLPWNCMQRRNVALLKAVLDGADKVVTIDDDNFIAQPDYFGAHQMLGSTVELDDFGQAGSWFNVCQFLSDVDGRHFFPRGYDLAPRVLPFSEPQASRPLKKRLVVNAGFWLGDPDIDAITRLAIPIDVKSYTRADNFFLAQGAWCPFNSQNTGLARVALPAYFLSPDIGRYDDIWASFVLKRVADHFGDGVAFGYPLVRQTRNAHDLFHDLDLELLGMRLTDKLVAGLETAVLSGSTYAQCVLELCSHLEKSVLPDSRINESDRRSLAAFIKGYRIWAELPLWS